MDQGAHFHQCDFQVHSPRDTNWNGKRPTNDEERKEYSERFVAACRQRGLRAVAITDHHDFVFFDHIKAAARAERDGDGNGLPEPERLVVYPGMELTLGVPCQALLILDATFPAEFLPQIYAILTIETNDPNAEQHPPVKVLEHFTTLSDLHERLDEAPW